MADVLPISDLQEAKKRDFWKIGDALVLLAYSCVVLWTIRYHEKWADEAQAWLIARDLDLRTIWFHELRYEGSPGLWHTILWFAQHVFHAGYGALSYIGASFAIAGAAVLLFFAPFPRYICWPLAFTYVMVYQYAVIARPYTLLPLLVFTVVILFKDTQHPGRISTVLILLALLTLHGAILAGCFGFAYLLEAAPKWREFDEALRWKYIVSAILLFLTLAFIVAILKPTPDVEEFALKKEIARLAESMNVKPPTPDVKFVSVLSGAFFGNFTLSVVFVLFTAWWCALRRKTVLFILPVSSLIVLYITVHGYSHHHGTITVAAIAAIWIAWPTVLEEQRLPRFDHFMTQAMGVLLALFCAFQIGDSGVVIKHEYLFPYSGAQDAADFLKSNGAERRPIYGFLYGITGIEAYFDHNIFANVSTSYFHHGVPLQASNLDYGELERVAPGHIVIFSEQPQLMLDSGVLTGLAPLGYSLVHFSDGYLLYRQGVYVRQSYFIYRRLNWDKN